MESEFVRKVGESEAQLNNDAAPVTIPSLVTEFRLGSAKLSKAGEKAVGTKSELDAIRVVSGLATKKRIFLLAKECEERWKDAKAWKATIPQSEATLGKVREA